MANSKFEYVRRFEQEDNLLKECWIVVRLDGHAFHRFSSVHNFLKPNDARALNLMNECAKRLMREYGDVVLGYGQSDEFSFVLHKSTVLWNRRSTKIQTCFVSYFTSCYVLLWSEHFPETRLQYPPSFDARIVLYPTKKILKDYLYWRQVDCKPALTSRPYQQPVQHSLLGACRIRPFRDRSREKARGNNCSRQEQHSLRSVCGELQQGARPVPAWLSCPPAPIGLRG